MKRPIMKYWLPLISFLLCAPFAYTQAKDIKPFQIKPMQLSVLGKSNYQINDFSNLKLSVYLPKNILVINKNIKWSIYKNNKLIKELKGKQHVLKLPTALYHIQLKIGQYHIQKPVQVTSGLSIQPYFPAKIGRLKLSTNHKVDWVVRDSESRTFTQTGSTSLDEIVPVGFYNVQLRFHNLPQYQRIHVRNGQQTTRQVEVPVGEVKLIALKDDQPLFYHMQWNIFRLHSGKRHHIDSYYLHSKRITLPPGLYEAVAIFQGKQQARQFWVQKNTHNKVVLAMD